MDVVQYGMAWGIMIAAGLNAVVADSEKEKAHHGPSFSAPWHGIRSDDLLFG